MTPWVRRNRHSTALATWLAGSCAASWLALSVSVAASLPRSAFAEDAPPATAPPPSLAPETANPPTADASNPPPPGLAPDAADPKVGTASETPEPKPSEAAPAEIPPAAQAEVSPPPSENNADSRQDNIIEAKHTGRIPYYQTLRPAWAVELTAAIKAFGGSDIANNQNGVPARALELQAEYQPQFLQSAGVFSFGPSFAIIPIGAPGTFTSSPASIWSVGGQVRYQARYFREQPFVPLAGFEAQYLTYHIINGPSGGTQVMGPFFGAMFLLNIIEPSAASELYIEDGIARSYLVAEYKLQTSGDGEVTVDAGSFYVGLRFEF